MRNVSHFFFLATCILALSLAQPMCGSVTNVRWTIADADRIPFAPDATVTVSFNLFTALQAADTITINYPSGFISTSPTPTANPATVSASQPGRASIVLNVVSGATISSGLYTVTLSGVTMGDATEDSSCAISVLTNKDRVSAGVPSGPIGNRVTNVKWTIADADRIPFAQNVVITVSFNLFTSLNGPPPDPPPTPPPPFRSRDPDFRTGDAFHLRDSEKIAQNIANSGDSITINYPSGLIALSATPGVDPSDSAASAPGLTGIVLTLKKAKSIPAGQYTLILSGVTMGSITPANATGITVSTSKDLASVAVPSNQLGGQVSGVAVDIAAIDRVPGATGTSVTVSFTTATPLSPNQLITLTWPASYLSGSIGLTYAGAPNTFVATPASINPNGLTIKVDAAGAAAAAYTITLTGVTMPNMPMVAGCSANIWVSTDTDLRSNNYVTTQKIGGQVRDASMTIAASDRIPYAPGKTVTLSFTTETLLPVGRFVTVTYPNGYFSACNPNSPIDGSDGFNATISPIGATANPFIILTTTVNVSAGSYVVTIYGVTLGGPNNGSDSCITLNTSSDLQATGGCPKLGGTVTNAVMYADAADRIPKATGKTVTVSFTTATPLSPNQLITLTWPASYLSGSIGLTYAGAPNTFVATPASINPNGLTIKVDAAGAAAAAYTITLTGVTMPNMPMAAGSQPLLCDNLNMYVSTVSTATDSAGLYVTPQIGGQVSGVAVDIAAIDRVPGATGTSVTVSFTTATPLSPNQLITLTWPASYLSGSIGLTYAGAPNTFVATPASINPNGLTIKVDAAGAAAAAYTITLTGSKLGNAIAAGTTGFLVGTDNDLPGNAGYPALGGVVTAATLTIAATDRIAGDNRMVTMSLSTASALSGGDSIFAIFNSNNAYEGFVLAPTTPNQPVVKGISASATLGKDNITLVVAQGANIFAGVVTVTICGVKLGSFPVDNSYGFSVSTTKDYTTTCSATGTVSVEQGQVAFVSMTIPWLSRFAGNVVQPIFAFKTQTDLPDCSPICGACSNRITVTFPENFFVPNLASACTAPVLVKGLNGYDLTGTGPTSTTTFVLTGFAGLPAATYAVTILGVTLGAPTIGNDSGITVQTSMDAASVGSPSGPISGYNVTSARLSSCGSSAQCQSLVIAFESNAPPISPGKSITIAFTAPSRVCNMVSDNQNAVISCYEGVISNLMFASYGTPVGDCRTGFALGACNFQNSLNTVFALCMGRRSCSVAASTTQFNPDPCPGVAKRLGIIATCSKRAPSEAHQFSTVSSGITSPLKGKPDAFSVGSALVTGDWIDNSPRLKLTVDSNSGSWNFGSSAVTITLTGMAMNSSVLIPSDTPQYVSIGDDGIGISSPSMSAMLLPTGAGAVKQVRLLIERAHPGVTNTVATISFRSSMGIFNNDIIRIYLPTGFFIDSARQITCVNATNSYDLRAVGVGQCSAWKVMSSIALSNFEVSNTLSTFDINYSGPDQIAGDQSITLAGVTLPNISLTSTTSFAVITTQNPCSSEGFVATGYIQNCDPGNYWNNSLQPCLPCPPGTFSSSLNSYSCTPCRPGTFSNLVNSTSCNLCPSGTFTSLRGSTKCEPCPAGHYCRKGSLEACACNVNQYQDQMSQSVCKPCPDQSVPETGQTRCKSQFSVTPSDETTYLWAFALFVLVGALALVLFIVIYRSRTSFHDRPFHGAICGYVFMFMPYAAFKSAAVWMLVDANSENKQLIADILLNASFSVYFVLGCGGKLALIQLWLHIVHAHTSNLDVMLTPGSDDSSLMSKAQRTWKLIKRSAFVVSIGYCIGFSLLVANFQEYLTRCADEASSTKCTQEAGVPPSCQLRRQGVHDLQIYNGGWAAAVVVVFSVYTYLFNGIVFVILTQNWHLTSWQRTVVSNSILKFLLKPFIGNLLEKEIQDVSNEIRDWRKALRSLANWLTLVSVFSFLLKAFITIDAVTFQYIENTNGLKYGFSIIAVEAVPSILSLLMLLRYHTVSFGQDAKMFRMKSFYSGNYRQSLLN